MINSSARTLWQHGRTGAGALALVGLLMVAGCDAARSAQPDIAPRPVTLAEFAQPDAGRSEQSAQPTRPSQEHTIAAAAPASDAGAASGNDVESSQKPLPMRLGASSPDVDASSTPAAIPDDVRLGEYALRPGDQVYVDGVIGQVSGRPVFVDEFLEPIADQLRQEARRLPPREFIETARVIIDRHLQEFVINELFLAEAEAALSVQQKQGLVAFLRDLQERRVAETRGSRILTERELQEEGLTLETFTEQERTKILISNLISRKIAPRVIVSWKDVEREYQRRWSEFNPPALVTFKTVAISSSETDLIEQINSLIEAGSSFERIVELAGEANVRTLDPLQMGPGGVSDVALSDVITPHLEGLEVGDTSRGFTIGSRTMWIHVASIDQPPGRSLYEVQRQLQAELRQRRELEERMRFIRSLFEQGIYDELELMSRRILAVAVQRYLR